jgi:hypothetical protein
LKDEAMPMDCVTFENIVHDLDRPGTQGAAQCESALAHAESCHKCATLLTQVEWLDFSMLKFAEIVERWQASPRVEAAVLEQFRRTKDLAARRQIGWRLAALATAAVLFLALGLVLRHRGLSSVPDAPSVVMQSAPDASVSKPSVAHLQPAAPDLNDADDADETTDAASFLRLPYADDSDSVDGGAIVRVELPRTALASFGLPVADSGDTQRILADLIVSADGTPEAIRLVSDANTSEEF